MLTGGTQPTCHDSGLFGEAVKTITHLRVGEEFAEVINNCSKDFAERANNAKQSASLKDKAELSALMPSEIQNLKIYERVVNEDKSDWYDKIPTSTEAGPMLSWACEGPTFEFKPPCLRCQSLYPTWILQGKPRDRNDEKETLVRNLFSHLVPPNPSIDMDWAYCAETVAASKLYLLRNGTLALV